MGKNSWYDAFPGAITVTDENEIIVNLNAISRVRPRNAGGI